MGLEIGKLHVRRSILINATPARVWAEFTSFERLKAWFGRGHDLLSYTPETGGAVELSVDRGSGPKTYGGQIVVFDSDREVSFTINWHDPVLAWPVPTFWTLRLTSLYDGTLVEIFHHGFERLGASAADELQGYEDGWNMTHLSTLRTLIET